MEMDMERIWFVEGRIWSWKEQTNLITFLLQPSICPKFTTAISKSSHVGRRLSCFRPAARPDLRSAVYLPEIYHSISKSSHVVKKSALKRTVSNLKLKKNHGAMSVESGQGLTSGDGPVPLSSKNDRWMKSYKILQRTQTFR